MIRRIRFDWSLPLVTLTELHVGLGESRAATPEEVQRGITGEVAAYVRDADDQPWIPGATLKGALRSGRYDAQANELFGMAHAETAAGTMPPVLASTVTVFGAFANPAAALEPFTRPRTAVSAGTGASEANKLFTEEWVPAGTEFTARFRLELRRREPQTGNTGRLEDDAAFEARAEDLRTRFEAELLRFCAADGVEIAADKSDGMGRVRLAVAQRGDQLVIPCTRRILDGNGWSQCTANETELEPPPPRASLHDIPLSCLGPYIAKGAVSTEQVNGQNRQTTTPERAGGLPRMHPSGVSGALRKCAEWMLALARLRDPNCWPDVDCKTSSGKKPLTILKRLFGDEGWRGSLNVDVVGIDCTGNDIFPFVALDVVTQAPVGGALFKFEADYGVSATLQISTFRDLSPEERDFLSALVNEVTENGIFLAGGSSKGFGWFNCPPTAPKANEARIRGLGQVDAATARRLPDNRITLPYRMINADTSRTLWPEKPVADRIVDGNLLSNPIPDGLCGWLDVSWCVETPILIGNGSSPVSPQMLNGSPVLPGATIRGLLRGIVETITQAQFGRLDRKTLDASVGKQIARAGALATHHNFRPDFARALFGHVVEPETAGQQQNSTTHQAHHLKSRLAFGYASLLNFEQEQIDNARIMKLASPNPAAAFYDSPGRKTYFATGETAQAVTARLDANQVHADDQITRLKFLNPRQNGPLVFRGRIRFHNVTLAELGALIWAVTFGGQPNLAHRIGHARAYGAGRGYADDLTLHIKRNDGNSVPLPEADETTAFQLGGHSLKPALRAFARLLHGAGLLDHQTIDDVKAAANSAVGEAMRASQLANGAPDGAVYGNRNKPGYQLSNTVTIQTGNGPLTFHGVDGFAASVRAAQGGRLAAMLRPKPED